MKEIVPICKFLVYYSLQPSLKINDDDIQKIQNNNKIYFLPNDFILIWRFINWILRILFSWLLNLVKSIQVNNPNNLKNTLIIKLMKRVS